MTKTHQRGFTLIELVVVIVILGILAAFAVPRFMGMEGEARAATVKSFGGSLKAAAAMARAKCQAQDCASRPAPNANTVDIDGLPVTMVLGYPNAATIQNTVDLTTAGFDPPTMVGAVKHFHKTGGAATCWVGYAPATAATPIPTITFGAVPLAGETFNAALARVCGG